MQGKKEIMSMYKTKIIQIYFEWKPLHDLYVKKPSNYGIYLVLESYQN